MMKLFYITLLGFLFSACGTEQNGTGKDTFTHDTPVETDDTATSEPAIDHVIPDTAPDHGPDIPVDGEEPLCTIDLVFAVDNSGSMQEEIRDFRENVWPQFAEALLEVAGGVEGEVFHVGVLDACPDPANFHTRGKSGECNFESLHVWMESNSSDLIGEFQCVGDIWDEDKNCSGHNDDEQPASAAATALEPPWITGPNAGFLRDDALLIIIAITDEDEQPTPDRSADLVYQRLIAVKGGDPKKMVFLGIGGSRDCEGPYGSADDAEKLKAITDLFIAQERGIFWDLCEGSLEDGLTEAMSVIDVACSELPVI